MGQALGGLTRRLWFAVRRFAGCQALRDQDLAGTKVWFKPSIIVGILVARNFSPTGHVFVFAAPAWKPARSLDAW